MGVELAGCPEPVGWVGNRNLIVPPDIVPVRRVSPIPRKKRTVCHPRPVGEPICRAGDREWFSDRLFVEFHTRDSRVAHGSSVTAHASCLIGVLLLISGQPAPATPVRVSSPLLMPAFVAFSGGGGSTPQLTLAASEQPAAASRTGRVTRTEPTRKVSTVPPPSPVAPAPGPDPEPRQTAEEETRIESDAQPDSSEDPYAGGAEGAIGGEASNGPSNGGSGIGAGTGVGGASGAGVGDGPSGVGMAPGPYRLGNGIEPPRKIKDVRPRYPAGALSSRALGSVLIEAVVGADGKVHDAKVLHSIPLLDQAALDAVRQWEFVPSTLNGVAVAVIISVLVQFSIH
jgi:periplasmic protein TonB